MTPSSASRGPTRRARVIGVGLSMEGTLEPLDQPLDRAVHVRIGHRPERGGFRPAVGEDAFFRARDRRLRLAQDRLPTLLRLGPKAVSKFKRLLACVPESPLALGLGPLPGPSDLFLDGLDSMESFLLVHEARS